MKNLSAAKKWFIFASIFAFASIISFFQIDSYWADKNDFNGLFGWLGIGIVTGIVAILGMFKSYSSSNSGKQE